MELKTGTQKKQKSGNKIRWQKEKVLLFGMLAAVLVCMLTSAVVAQNRDFNVKNASLLELQEHLRYRFATEDYDHAREIIRELKQRNSDDKSAQLYEKMIENAEARKGQESAVSALSGNLETSLDIKAPGTTPAPTPTPTPEPTPAPTPYVAPTPVKSSSSTMDTITDTVENVPGGWITVGSAGGAIVLVLLVLVLKPKKKKSAPEAPVAGKKEETIPPPPTRAQSGVSEDMDTEISGGPYAPHTPPTMTAVEQDTVPQSSNLQDEEDSFAPWDTASEEEEEEDTFRQMPETDEDEDDQALAIFDEDSDEEPAPQAPSAAMDETMIDYQTPQSDELKMQDESQDSDEELVQIDELENPLDQAPTAAGSPVSINDVLGQMPDAEIEKDDTFFDSEEETLIHETGDDSIFQSEDVTVSEKPEEESIYNLLGDEEIDFSDEDTFFGSQEQTQVRELPEDPKKDEEDEVIDFDNEDTRQE